MIVVTLLVLWQPHALLHFFETDPASADTAISYLQVMSWTLVAQGLVYTCAFMFQALDNTLPALFSAIARFVIFSVPAIWLSYQPAFHTDQVWLLLSGSIAVQAGVSLWLLHVEFKRKLSAVAAESRTGVLGGDSYTPEPRGRVDG